MMYNYGMRGDELVNLIEHTTPEGEKYFDVCINQVLVGEMVMNDDGYYVFFYSNNGGYWESVPLRAIADRLDEINKDWDTQVRTDLKRLEMGEI